MKVLRVSSEGSSAAQTAKLIKKLLKEVNEERADAIRLDELRQVFAKLVANHELEFGKAAPDNEIAAKWQAFLLTSHKSMITQLCKRIRYGKRPALRCMWGVIASSPLKSQNGLYEVLNEDLLKKSMKSIMMIEGDIDKSLRHMTEVEFLRPYRDVQYYTLGVLAQLAKEEYTRSSKEESETVAPMAEKLLQILMMIPLPKSSKEMDDSQYLFTPADDAEPDDKEVISDEDDMSDDESSDDDSEDEDERPVKKQKVRSRSMKSKQKNKKKKFAFQRLGSFRAEYQKAWIAVLKLKLEVADLKKVLQFLPTEVLPYIPSALRFSDFFMNAYSDHGSGVIGVLALEGLFLLIIGHGLEYTDFYKQLYRLVTPRVLYAKYRVRFFDLLTKCIARNNMLPAHLIAAFCKRLCRCALSSPPPGIIFCLGLVSNLLKMHPECACLTNRIEGDEISDEFIASEDDPVKCRALKSSLWELGVLERHYLPAIQTLAKSIGTVEESKMPMHTMEDFYGHTYTSLFDQERKRRAQTALAFEKPKRLFTKNDIFADILET